jgi:hypothetical protein
MRGTGIEKEVEICVTNITNKTKCMSNSLCSIRCSLLSSRRITSEGVLVDCRPVTKVTEEQLGFGYQDDQNRE